MLDERWSADVEEVGDALRKMLAVESSPARVRMAEENADGRDRDLEARLDAFGLAEIETTPEMFSRIALELGRALASTAYVETIPVLAVLGRGGVGCGFDGLVAAALDHVAVRHEDGLYIEAVNGAPRRTTAGDFIVEHCSPGPGFHGVERVGDPGMADRVARFEGLTQAAKMVGASQALLAYGAAYAKEREQFGRAIATYQGVSHRLARAAGEIDAAELLVRKAAFIAAPHNGGDGAPAEIFAIMAHAKAVEAARFVATNVHQVFGGNGFAMEYDVQLYSRRLRSWAMRGPRASHGLTRLGRMVLDPAQRDGLRLLWHYEEGMPLPRWAEEADSLRRRRGQAPEQR